MMLTATKTGLGKKGIATWIAQLLTGLFAIGVIALIYFMMFSRYFDIHVIVKSNEAKRHVINMAQVMMSSHRLVHEDSFDDGSKRYYRGVFNSTKLDDNLGIEGDLRNIILDKGAALRDEISYPDTATRIVITDLETGKVWLVSFGSPGLENIGQLMTCFLDKIPETAAEWLEMFKPSFSTGIKIESPWSKWDVEECYETYTSKIGVFSQDFPVMIYNDGEMHPGRLFLRVMEL